MIAKCRYNRGSDISKAGTKFFTHPDRSLSLEVGRTYRVYGFMLRDWPLMALVLDDGGHPNWYPVQLFEWVEQAMPSEWGFVVREIPVPSFEREREPTVEAVWGYVEFVRDVEYSNSLLDRQAQSLNMFFLRVASDALQNGVLRDLRSRGMIEAVQLAEVLQGVAKYLDQPPDKAMLMRPTAKAVQLLVDGRNAIVGDLALGEAGRLCVLPWESSGIESCERIERKWDGLFRRELPTEVVGIELTAEGRSSYNLGRYLRIDDIALTAGEAFLAMGKYVAAFGSRVKPEAALATLWSGISIEKDRSSGDPAALDDWLLAVQEVIDERKRI